MSANSDLGTSAANSAHDWQGDVQQPANDISAKPRSNISSADAFGALADAVTAHINAPTRLKDRRKAVNNVSELLREAFCMRSSAIAPLPTQLGSNHEAAADYVYEQLDRWAAQPALTKLFDTVGLASDFRPMIIMSTMRRVPAEEIGVWVATEFGGLSAPREAAHCRGYVATKISAALFDLSSAQPTISAEGTKALQHQLDDWAAPTGEIDQSLHYQMVIAPFLSFFHDIATGRVAGTQR